MTAPTAARVEREVKLGAWAGLVMPDLDGLVPGARVELLPPLRLTATYYDTADLRLARWGVTVRHRTSVPPTSELPWTVKLPAGPGGGETLARRELEFSGPEGRVPATVAHLIRGLSRNGVLVPVARLRTDRRRWELRDAAGAALVEIADDEVSVMVSGPGGPEMLLGSADLMPRNLDHRVEVMFPVVAPELVDRLRDILALALADDVEAWELHPDGAWTRVPTVAGVSIQDALRADAIERASSREDARSRVQQ